ncbi:MAG: hypothetical protein U9Q71_06575 [Pseudomonadota bacterium]|nr:hypothetical protein [Pseudomonadota bacterium]
MKIALRNTLLFTLFSLILCACDSGSSTDSGGGQAKPEPKLIGPDLNGDDWVGYYKSASGKYEPMTAVIDHVGNKVAIQTSIKSGVASKLSGKINSIGKMILYDAYDNEDWTTLYGPASKNSINLADFVFKDNHKTHTNVIILKR